MTKKGFKWLMMKSKTEGPGFKFHHNFQYKKKGNSPNLCLDKAHTEEGYNKASC